MTSTIITVAVLVSIFVLYKVFKNQIWLGVGRILKTYEDDHKELYERGYDDGINEKIRYFTFTRTGKNGWRYHEGYDDAQKKLLLESILRIEKILSNVQLEKSIK